MSAVKNTGFSPALKRSIKFCRVLRVVFKHQVHDLTQGLNPKANLAAVCWYALYHQDNPRIKP